MSLPKSKWEMNLRGSMRLNSLDRRKLNLLLIIIKMKFLKDVRRHALLLRNSKLKLMSISRIKSDGKGNPFSNGVKTSKTLRIDHTKSLGGNIQKLINIVKECVTQLQQLHFKKPTRQWDPDYLSHLKKTHKLKITYKNSSWNRRLTKRSSNDQWMNPVVKPNT